MNLVKRFLGRLSILRGNPEFISRLVFVLVCILVAVAIFLVPALKPLLKDNIWLALASASVAVALSNFVDLGVKLLAKPRLRGIPLDIAEAAANEISCTSGYYRTNCNICIKLDKHEERNILAFCLKSLIVRKGTDVASRPQSPTDDFPKPIARSPAQFHSEMPPPEIVIYRHDGRDVSPSDPEKLAVDVTDEYLEVHYKIIDEGLLGKGFADEHRFTSGISGGLTVEFKGLQEYQLEVIALRGTQREKERFKDAGSSRYTFPDALLSQQGFRWSITKRA